MIKIGLKKSGITNRGRSEERRRTGFGYRANECGQPTTQRKRQGRNKGHDYVSIPIRSIGIVVREFVGRMKG